MKKRRPSHQPSNAGYMKPILYDHGSE